MEKIAPNIRSLVLALLTSAERSLFNGGPFDTDTDLDFRVALVMESQ